VSVRVTPVTAEEVSVASIALIIVPPTFVTVSALDNAPVANVVFDVLKVAAPIDNTPFNTDIFFNQSLLLLEEVLLPLAIVMLVVVNFFSVGVTLFKKLVELVLVLRYVEAGVTVKVGYVTLTLVELPNTVAVCYSKVTLVTTSDNLI